MPMDLKFIQSKTLNNNQNNQNNNKNILDSLILVVGYESGHICLFHHLSSAIDHDHPSVKSTCIRPHSDPILSIASYSSGGHKTIISGSADNSVALAEVHVPEASSSHSKDTILFASDSLNRFEAKGGISDLSPRVDERILIAGGWDRRVHVFDLRKQRPLAILKYHSDSVMCVAYSPLDLWEPHVNTHWGYLIASGGKDKRIAVWSIYPPSSKRKSKSHSKT
eukprot:gb/GECH01001647.1/.p1 GENE.gb/GECH01001647.1/~~gb/GECH01001647.1/.p1  ORF type:complete len:223 (+),score=43.84 gb/GECH01001647.1/:1-669(+)